MRLRSGAEVIESTKGDNPSSASSSHIAKEVSSVNDPGGVDLLVNKPPCESTLLGGVCSGSHGCDSVYASRGVESDDQMHSPHQTPSTAGAGEGNTSSLIPHNKWVVLCMKLAGAALVISYFILPAVIRLNPWILYEVAFLHRVRWPPFVNLSYPAELGLNTTQSFQLETTESLSIGVWHTLPSDLEGGPLAKKDYTLQMSNGSPVVLYLHGNAGTRAGWHRIQLYKVLAKAGFHVVAIDYRGYGDSTGSPTEDGLCSDAMAAYKWILQHSGNSPVYIWGHSMGSGVATKVAKQICDADLPLSGLFLEAPFNNIIEATVYHPFSQPFRYMPWFTWAFVEAMKMNNIHFYSDKSIASVTAPTLILHAEDDGIVPYILGKKLYESALISKERGGVQFITFDGQRGYGHKHIHKAPELPSIIHDFIHGSSLPAT